MRRHDTSFKILKGHCSTTPNSGIEENSTDGIAAMNGNTVKTNVIHISTGHIITTDYY